MRFASFFNGALNRTVSVAVRAIHFSAVSISPHRAQIRVGFSDANGRTNTSLLNRAYAVDGTILGPSRAITALDATLYGRIDAGFVLSTYTENGFGDAAAHFFLAHSLTGEIFDAFFPRPLFDR